MISGLRSLWAGENRPHSLVLGLCLAVLAVGLILQRPKADETRLSIAKIEIPPICAFKRTWGIDCPGCGLTRSVVDTVHGNLPAAWAWNPVGPLVVVFLILQIMRRSAYLFWPVWSQHYETRWGRILDCGIIILPVLMLVQWLLRLFNGTLLS